VRRLAGIEFEGFTYPERFIKSATSFDFGIVNSKIVYRNYFSDPVEWCNLFKVQGKRPPGLWRAIFPIPPDEDDETAAANCAIEVVMSVDGAVRGKVTYTLPAQTALSLAAAGDVPRADRAWARH